MSVASPPLGTSWGPPQPNYIREKTLEGRQAAAARATTVGAPTSSTTTC